MLYDMDFASIYFGDSKDGLNLNDLDLLRENLDILRTRLNLRHLFFLKQVHGIDSILITDDPISRPVDLWSYSGDLIVSNKKGVGIGVLTADCLPVVLFDLKNKVSSIVHAGWQGSIQKICLKAIRIMQEKFRSKIDDLKIYFGPCARKCCYEVGQNFIDKLKAEKIVFKSFIVKKGNKIFFDLVHFNQQQFYDLGVLNNQIITDHCLCTICNGQFCSHRRDKSYRRQATIAVLK